jgi:GntR family transcriptional regulator/MocR family aminotransferase
MCALQAGDASPGKRFRDSARACATRDGSRHGCVIVSSMDAFPFALDLSDVVPGGLARELHRRLREAILDGRLAARAELPATRTVALALGIARNTVVAAYDLLIAEGYAIARPGARTTVAASAMQRVRRPRGRSSAIDPRLAPAWRGATRPTGRGPLPPRCFRLGVPEHREFPHALWRRITTRVQREIAREGFSYPPSEGIPSLRAAIAQHVAFTRAVACSADDPIVTAGAQQAFDLIARLLVTPGQTRVAVEEPGYPPLRAAFAAAGARLVSVPVDDEGLCVERLPDDVRVVSVTPSHQSPTGAVLAPRRRLALLEFARRRQASIVEDDYDGEFRFGMRPLDALQTLDRDASVFYVGTFSKSLFPALRKGFIVAPGWAQDGLVAIKHAADSHCDAITQRVLAAFIAEGHLARHVRRMRRIYAERREALLAALRGPLAAWFEPIPSEAGLHLAARVRDPRQLPTLLAQLQRHAPGARSVAEYAAGRGVPAMVAFGYGVIDADEIRGAMARLARALRR